MSRREIVLHLGYRTKSYGTGIVPGGEMVRHWLKRLTSKSFIGSKLTTSAANVKQLLKLHIFQRQYLSSSTVVNVDISFALSLPIRR